MDQLGDNTFGYQCHYSSYCSGKLNKILRKGTGAVYDHRTPTSTSSVVTSSTKLLSKTVTEITVSALVGYVPSNTSIELEVSNDGGTTWISGIFNQKLIFSNQVLAWFGRLINGTSTETPVLDFVALTYSTSCNHGYSLGQITTQVRPLLQLRLGHSTCRHRTGRVPRYSTRLSI